MKFFSILVCFVSLCGFAERSLTDAAQTLLDSHPDTRRFEGKEGWVFLANELRHLAKGTDWVTPETEPEPAHSHPLAALKTLKTQLDDLGIELIFMPVPAKAAVYSDFLSLEVFPDSPTGSRLFLQQLEQQGFTVIDLHPLYAEEKTKGTQLYCKTDTHWSPAGALLAAGAAADLLSTRPWMEEPKKIELSLMPTEELTFQGDLVEEPTQETLPFRKVQASDEQPAFQDNSPVLILGDSHTLVFSTGGDMHAEDGGFPELLAHALQLPVERIANRGSASTPPRLTLYRKAAANPEWLEGKKAIIYVFTAREWTESLNGWRAVPVSPRFR
jgi:alginate O-acetyltransferase complex protein AlgJ